MRDLSNNLQLSTFVDHYQYLTSKKQELESQIFEFELKALDADTARIRIYKIRMNQLKHQLEELAEAECKIKKKLKIYARFELSLRICEGE